MYMINQPFDWKASVSNKVAGPLPRAHACYANILIIQDASTNVTNIFAIFETFQNNLVYFVVPTYIIIFIKNKHT